LNITCNFLYCSHQVHRDFLITLYYNRTDKMLTGLHKIKLEILKEIYVLI